MRARPTKQELEAARSKTVRDVIASGLDVVFCGINPGLYTAAIGHHFGKPGNRFWPALHLSGFTPEQLSPYDERDLLAFGLGITNLVMRTTASADELTDDELRTGAAALRRKVLKYKPSFLAILGLGAYRVGFGVKTATVGPQEDTIGSTRIWLLPNPSGLNAHYQLPALVREFRRLHRAAKT